MPPNNNSVSLLSQHLVNLLDLVEPQWRRHPIPAAGIEAAARDTLSSCGITTLGDLTVIDPLTLLALAAVVPMPNNALGSSGAPFWSTMTRAACEHIVPAIERKIIDLLVARAGEWRGTSPTSKREVTLPGDSPASTSQLMPKGDDITSAHADPASKENDYSSLFADVQVAFDAAKMSATFVQYFQGPTEMRLPAVGECIVLLTGRKLATTPLLSRGVRDVLRDLGCDLHHLTLSALNLSVRTFNTCHRSGIKTLDALAQMTPKDLLDIRNFGIKSYREVHDVLLSYLAPRLDRVPMDVLVPGDAAVQDASAQSTERATGEADGGVP